MLIGVAALLSTASAINATLYGGGRTGYLVAKLGELPEAFEAKIKHGYEGMVFLALFGIVFALAFDLHNISVAGSLGFLIIFMLVNLANYRLRDQTGANRLIAGLGTLMCFAATVVLVGYNALYHPHALASSLVLVGATALFTFVYVRFNKKMAAFIDRRLAREERGKTAAAHKG